MNFTPSASSLIVLNIVMQNKHVFKDARSFNSFKKHCNALKADLEAAPRPASDRRSSPAPPKCWFYSLKLSESMNRSIEQAKVNDLEEQMVDPLENLIGFYSVVGRSRSGQQYDEERSPSVVSQGAAGSSNARSQGVTSALCVRTSDLSKNAIIGTSTSKKNNTTVSKKVSNAH